MRHRSSALAALFAVVLAAPSAVRGAPRWERLSWTGPTDTTMTVSWTDDAAGTGQVEYRPAGGGAAVTVPADGVATGSGDLDVTYSATLTDLRPDTEYEYHVFTGGRWSDWYVFRTAPPAGSCAPFRFAALGDNRGQELFGYYIPSLQWDDVAVALAAERPRFTLDTGDFIYDGANTEQWPPEMDSTTPLSRVSPFFLTFGNHDDGPGQGAGANLNKMFAYPTNNPDGVEDYFWFVAGNVLVVSLSTYTFSMDAQIAWLRGVLEDHRDAVDWRVVQFHTPVWSSGAHGSNEDNKPRADLLVPILDDYGVDLVFNGHDHDYERFHPSRGGYGGRPHVWTPLAEDGGTRGIAEGPIYIVTGGGGALANPIFTSTLAHSARGLNHLNFVVVDVEGGTMRVTTRDCGLQLTSWTTADCSGTIEQFTLEKASTVCTGGADADADADADGDGDADADGEPDAAADDGAATPDVARDAEEDAPRDAPTADAATDAPVDATTPPASGGSGCGCRAPAGRPSGLLLLLATLGAVSAVRRRGRGREEEAP